MRWGDVIAFLRELMRAAKPQQTMERVGDGNVQIGHAQSPVTIHHHYYAEPPAAVEKSSPDPAPPAKVTLPPQPPLTPEAEALQSEILKSIWPPGSDLENTVLWFAESKIGTRRIKSITDIHLLTRINRYATKCKANGVYARQKGQQ